MIQQGKLTLTKLVKWLLNYSAFLSNKPWKIVTLVKLQLMRKFILVLIIILAGYPLVPNPTAQWTRNSLIFFWHVPMTGSMLEKHWLYRSSGWNSRHSDPFQRFERLDEAELGTGELVTGTGTFLVGALLWQVTWFNGIGNPLWAVGANKKTKLKWSLWDSTLQASLSYGLGV